MNISKVNLVSMWQNQTALRLFWRLLEIKVEQIPKRLKFRKLLQEVKICSGGFGGGKINHYRTDSRLAKFNF